MPALSGDLYAMSRQASGITNAADATNIIKGISRYRQKDEEEEADASVPVQSSAMDAVVQDDTSAAEDVQKPEYTAEQLQVAEDYYNQILSYQQQWLGKDFQFSPVEAESIRTLVLNSDNPQETAARYMASASLSSMLGISKQSAWENLDAIAEYYTGTTFEAKTVPFTQKIANGFEWCNIRAMMDEWRRLDLEGKEEEAKALESQIQERIDAVGAYEGTLPLSVLDNLSNAFWGNLGYMAVPAMKGATSKFGFMTAASLLAGSVPALLAAPVTAAAVAVGGAMATAETYKTYFEWQRGQTYWDNAHNGGEQNKVLNSYLSTLSGLFTSTVETFIDGAGAKMINAVTGDSVKKIGISALVDMNTKGTVSKVANAGFKWLAEGLDEGLFNEIPEYYADEVVDAIYSKATGVQYDKTAMQRTKEAFKSGLEGIFIGLAYGGLDIPFSMARQNSASIALRQAADRSMSWTEFLSSTNDMKPEEATQEDFDEAREKIFKASQEYKAGILKEAYGGTVLESVETAQEELYSTIDSMGVEQAKVLPDGSVYRTEEKSLYSEVEENGNGYTVFFGDRNTGAVYGTVEVGTDGNVQNVTGVRVRHGYEGIRSEMVRDAIAQTRSSESDVQWNPTTPGLQSVKDTLVETNPRGKEYGLNYESKAVGEDADIKAMADNIKKNAPNLTDQEALVSARLQSIADTGFKVTSVDELTDAELKGRSRTSFNAATNAAKSLIYLGQQSNVSSFTHELFHAVASIRKNESAGLSLAIHDTINDDVRRAQFTSFINDHKEIWENANDNSTVEDIVSRFEQIAGNESSWAPKLEEDLARLWEAYASSSNSIRNSMPSEVRTIMQKLSDMIRKVYRTLRNGVALDPEIAAAYNRLMNLEDNNKAGNTSNTTESSDVKSDDKLMYQEVREKDVLDELENGKTVKAYRAMQVIDGKLYPPMAAVVGGKRVEETKTGTWYRADEHPELVNKDGKFVLDKGGKDATGKKLTLVPAAYNPYWHTSRSMLNDQFSSAYKRPNLVTVEVEIPESELTSGYKAEGAKDSVGLTEWHSGPVASKLKKIGKPREVILSRYVKVNRIISDAEAAESIAKTLEGTDIAIPDNTVTPTLLAELKKLGVDVIETDEVKKYNNSINLAKNGNDADAAFLSFQDSQDAEYLAAVERGDMETAQRMVDAKALNAGYITSSDYRMAHHAPYKDAEGFHKNMPNAFNGELVPKDALVHPEWYWYMDSKPDQQSYRAVVNAIRKYNRDGHATIKMYRGVVADVKEDSFRNGDWITPSRLDAELEGAKNEKPYRIIEQEVNIEDVWWNGDSISEWGYDDGKGYAYSNVPNNRKLMDAVTYDDGGNVIPLSKRFDKSNPDVRFQDNGGLTFVAPEDERITDFSKEAAAERFKERNIDFDYNDKVSTFLEKNRKAIVGDLLRMGYSEVDGVKFLNHVEAETDMPFMKEFGETLLMKLMGVDVGLLPRYANVLLMDLYGIYTKKESFPDGIALDVARGQFIEYKRIEGGYRSFKERVSESLGNGASSLFVSVSRTSSTMTGDMNADKKKVSPEKAGEYIQGNVLGHGSIEEVTVFFEESGEVYKFTKKEVAEATSLSQAGPKSRLSPWKIIPEGQYQSIIDAYFVKVGNDHHPMLQNSSVAEAMAGMVSDAEINVLDKVSAPISMADAIDALTVDEADMMNDGTSFSMDERDDAAADLDADAVDAELKLQETTEKTPARYVSGRDNTDKTFAEFVKDNAPQVIYEGTDAQKDQQFREAVMDDSNLIGYLSIIGEALLVDTASENAYYEGNVLKVNPFVDEKYRLGLQRRVSRQVNDVYVRRASKLALENKGFADEADLKAKAVKELSDNARYYRNILAALSGDKSMLPESLIENESRLEIPGRRELNRMSVSELADIAASVGSQSIVDKIIDGTLRFGGDEDDQMYKAVSDVVKRQEDEIREFEKKLDEADEKTKERIAEVRKSLAENRRRLRDLKAIRNEKAKVANSIMKPVNLKTTDYDTSAKAIQAIQALIDPSFRREWLYDISRNPGQRTEMKEFGTMSIDEAKAYFNGLDDAQRIDIMQYLSPSLVERLTEQRKPLNDWTLADLKTLADQVESLRDKGRTILSARREAEAERDNAIRRSIINALQGKLKGKGKTLPGSIERQKENSSFNVKLQSWLYATYRPQELAQLLDGGFGYHGAAYRLLIDDKRFHQNREWLAVDKRLNKVDPLLTDKVIDQLVDTVTVDLGRGYSRTFTIDELAYVYLSINDESNHDAVAYGALLDEYEKGTRIADVEDPLTGENIMQFLHQNPELIVDDNELVAVGKQRFNAVYQVALKELGDRGLMEVVKAIGDDFNDAGNRERLNRASIEAYNVPLDARDYYLSIRRVDSNKDPIIDDAVNGILDIGTNTVISNPEGGFLVTRKVIKPRNQGNIDLSLVGNWRQAVADQEHLIENASYVKQLRSVFASRKSKEVARAIDQAYGTSLRKEIVDYIELITNPSKSDPKTNFDKAVKAFRGRTGAAYLGWKTSGIILQGITSPMPGLSEINPAKLTAAYLQIGAHPIETINMINEKSVFMKKRTMDMIVDEAIKRRSQWNQNGFQKFMNKQEEIGQIGLTLVDRYAVAGNWLAMYNMGLQENLRNGMDTDVAEAAAVQRADNFILRTQPVGDSTEMASMFRKGNELSKAVLQFQASLNVIWNNIIPNTIGFARNREYGKILGTMVGYAMAGVILGLVADGFDDDDDTKKKMQKLSYWSITQQLSSVPLISVTGIDNLVNKLITGKSEYSGQGVTIFPGVDKTVQAINSVRQGDWEKAASKTGEAAGIFLGAPTSAIKQYARAATGDLGALLGR